MDIKCKDKYTNQSNKGEGKRMKSIKEQSLVNQQHNDKIKLTNDDDSNTLMKRKQCLGCMCSLSE